MRDIWSMRDDFHSLEQIHSQVAFNSAVHYMDSLKFNRCIGAMRGQKSRTEMFANWAHFGPFWSLFNAHAQKGHTFGPTF